VWHWRLLEERVQSYLGLLARQWPGWFRRGCASASPGSLARRVIHLPSYWTRIEGQLKVEDPDEASKSVKEILSYFLRNPEAVDSLEGIARWRLLEQRIHANFAETQGALQWLVKEGYLIEIKHPHSAVLFRLDAEQRERAQLLLRNSKLNQAGEE
jgi:hypothetical protein